jgi:hypothetical protein
LAGQRFSMFCIFGCILPAETQLSELRRAAVEPFHTTASPAFQRQDSRYLDPRQRAPYSRNAMHDPSLT